MARGEKRRPRRQNIGDGHVLRGDGPRVRDHDRVGQRVARGDDATEIVRLGDGDVRRGSQDRVRIDRDIIRGVRVSYAGWGGNGRRIAQRADGICRQDAGDGVGHRPAGWQHQRLIDIRVDRRGIEAARSRSADRRYRHVGQRERQVINDGGAVNLGSPALVTTMV